jgi:hypothetical protein
MIEVWVLKNMRTNKINRSKALNFTNKGIELHKPKGMRSRI